MYTDGGSVSKPAEGCSLNSQINIKPGGSQFTQENEGHKQQPVYNCLFIICLIYTSAEKSTTVIIKG